MKKYNFDLLDLKILTELDNNARQSATQIARKVRANKNTVLFRIKRLEEEKIITHYYTIIDMAALGYSNYRIMLCLQNVTLAIQDEILSYLSEQSETWWVGKGRGSWDIGILVWVKNSRELDDFWRNFEERYKQYIADFNTTIYLRLHQFALPFLDKKPSVVTVIGDSPHVELDVFDKKLLTFISSHARSSIIEIGKKTNLTPMQVVYRMKHLQEGVIKKYTVAVDLNKLGLHYWKGYFYLRTRRRLSELKEFVRSIPALFYIDENLGIDFEPNFLVKDEKESNWIVDAIMARFGEEIDRKEFVTYTDIVKIAYVPAF